MNELIERLGWVLVHSLWQFALLALIAGVISRAMRRNSSAARYGVHVVAMGVMVVVPLLTWLVLSNTAHDGLANRAALAPGHEAIPTNSPGADAARLTSTTTFEDPTPDDTTSTRRPGDVSPPVMKTSLNSETTGGPTPPARQETLSWSQRAKTALQPWLTWIVAVWCIGVAVCSLRPLLGWHMLWRLKRVGVSPVSEDVLTSSKRASERLRLRRAVSVLQSTLAQVPVVVGYLQPVILLPVSLMTSLPAEHLEAILAHELAHVRRHDFVVNLLQTLVETFFFYHPAVWWLSHQIRVEREHCCDDLVVASFGNRIEYGRALLAIEELRGRNSVLALGAADGSLLSRIRRIVGIHSDHAANERWPAAFIALSLIGAMSALSMTWSLVAEDAETVISESVPKPKPERYVAELPNGVQVEFVGLAATEAEPKTWWKPDGSPLSDVPKHGSEAFSVTGQDIRRAIIRVHGETVGYQEVTAPGMSSSVLAEPPRSGGPFIQISGGFAFPPGQKTGHFEVGIATLQQSPARYLNAKGQRVTFVRRANAARPPGTLVVDRVSPGQLTDINNLLGVGSLTRRQPGALLVDEAGGSEPATVEIGELKTIADQITEDIEVISVDTPPLRMPAMINGKPVISAEKEADNKVLSHQTQITWRAPNVPKPMSLELVLIDVHGRQHRDVGTGVKISEAHWAGDTHWGKAERHHRFDVPISRVSGFEYRVRPYQHWVTFDNVALNPGELTDVKVQVESQLPRPAPNPAPNESTNFAPIEGEVIDSVTGKQIEGATVRFRFRKLSSLPIRDEKPLAELVFRNVGKFTFELPDTVKGQTDLFVERFAEHPDYQSLGATGHGFYFLSKAEPSHARNFIRQVKMVPGKVVSGRVLDLNGQPAKGVAVTSGFNREGWQNGNAHKTITDANGRYRMVVPESSGRGRIYVNPSHAAAVSRAITPEFGEQPVFQLLRGTRLFGRVTDAKGRGVANVVVRADGSDRVPLRHAMTDADGKYSLPPCQYGTYLVELYDEGRFPELPQNGVRLPDVFLHQVVDLPKTAPTRQQLDFKPTDSVRMTARYTTSDDQPVSGRSLSVMGVANKVGWWGRLREVTDQPGLYELRVPRGFEGRIDQNSDDGFLRITREAADGAKMPERYVTKFDEEGLAFHIVRLKPSSVTLRPTFDGKPVKPTGPLNFPQFADSNDAQRVGARLPTSQARTPDGDKLWFDVHPNIDLLVKLNIPGFKPWQETVQIKEGEDRVIDVLLESQ